LPSLFLLCSFLTSPPARRRKQQRATSFGLAASAGVSLLKADICALQFAREKNSVAQLPGLVEGDASFMTGF
jgi:hypothetical protein